MSVFSGEDQPVEIQLARVSSVPQELPKSVDIAFTITSVLSFQGEINSYLNGTSFSLTGAQYKIQCQNWDSTAHFSKGFSQIKGNSNIPSMTVDVMGIAFQINNIATKVDIARSKYGNWLGDSSFSIGQTIAQLPGIEITHFNSQEISTLKDNLINLDWKIQLEKVSIGNMAYGPLNLDIQFNHLKPVVLNELTKTKGQLKNPEETFKRFLSVRPEIVIKDSSVMLPQGLVSLNAGLEFGGPDISIPINSAMIEKTMDGHILAVIPMEILREGLGMGLRAGIEKDPEYLKLDEALKKQYFAQQIDLKINKLVTEGFLSEQDKNYVVKISIEKGKWIANGKEIAQPLS